MDAGLVAAWDILELTVELDATLARSANTYRASASGSLLSQYAPNFLIVSDQIRIDVESIRIENLADASGEGRIHFDLDAFGIDETETITGGAPANIEASVEIDDVTLHIVHVLGSPVWMMTTGDVRCIVNGGTVHTEAGPHVLIGELFAPAGIPVIGIPPKLAAGATVSPMPTSPALGGANPGAPADCNGSTGTLVNVSAESTVTKGWRFKRAGSASWVALDVNLLAVTPPSVTCDPTATTVTPSAGNTYAGSCSAKAWILDVVTAGTEETDPDCQLCSNGAGSGWGFTPWTRALTFGEYEGEIMLLPDLPKSVKRWGDGTDYGALIKRWGLPYALGGASATCIDYTEEDPTDYDSVVEEFFPTYAMTSADVLNAANAIEDPLGEDSYAPYAYSGYLEESIGTCAKTTTTGTCPPVGIGEDPPDPPTGGCVTLPNSRYRHSVESGFGPTVEDSDENPELWGPLDHDEAIVRYINYCVNPHWSYFYYFPANTIDSDDNGTLDKQDEWEVGGAEIENEYFLDSRSQLTIAEKRNSLISAPLRDGKHSLWLKDRIGSESSWWGITRHQARQFLPAANKTLDSDSSSLWSATDATLAFAGSITVNPSAIDCEVKLDIGSLTVEWWWYPHLARQIAINWTATNVVSMSVYLESIDGSSRTLLGTTTGTKSKPTTATDTRYAGSWKQEMGAGYYPDEGADTLASGISGATMGDVERSHHFLLLSGMLAAYLVYVIEVADVDVDVTLNYPQFIAPTTAPFVYPENGHQNCIVWADGPGVRFGSHRWWDYDGDTELSSPVVDVPGTVWGSLGFKPSVLDALRYENLLALGKSYDDGITTVLAGLYDSTEGQAKENAAWDTISFMVKSNSKAWLVLVNTFAECPPLAMFPRKARDTDLAETGSEAQEAWSYALLPRYYIAAQEQLDIYDPVGLSTWTSNLAGVPTPWVGSKHSHVVDNAEGFFDVKFGSTKVAEMRPWHGAFAVFPADGLGSYAKIVVSHDRSAADRHVFAWIDDGTDKIVIGRSANVAPFQIDSALTAITAEWVCVGFARNSVDSRLYVLTEETGAIKLYSSTDEGRTLSVATTVETGPGNSKPGHVIMPDGQIMAYWIVTASSKIEGKIYDAALNVLQATFDAVAAGVSDAGICVRERVIENGRRKVIIEYIDTSGNVVIVESDDGRTFS